MDSLCGFSSNLSPYSYESKSSTADVELSCTRVSDSCEKPYVKKGAPLEHKQKIAGTSLPHRAVSIPGSAARTFEELFLKAGDRGFSKIDVHASLTHKLIKGGGDGITYHRFDQMSRIDYRKQLDGMGRKYQLIPSSYNSQTEFQRKGFNHVWNQVSLYDMFIHEEGSTVQLMDGTEKFLEYLDKYESELEPNEFRPKEWLISLYKASLNQGDRFADLCRLWTECSHLTAVNDNVLQVTTFSVNSDKYTYNFNWDFLYKFLPVRMVDTSFVNNKCSRSLRSNRFCAAPVLVDFARHESGENNSSYARKRKRAKDFVASDDGKRPCDRYNFVCQAKTTGLKMVISRVSVPMAYKKMNLSKIGKESVLLSRCDANANSSYLDVQDPILRGRWMMPHTANAATPDNLRMEGGEQSGSDISLSDSSSTVAFSDDQAVLNTGHLTDAQTPEETAQFNSIVCAKKVLGRSASVVAAADSTQDLLSDDVVSKDSETEEYSGGPAISNADETAPLSDNDVGKGSGPEERSDEVAISIADETAAPASPADHRLLQENDVSDISQEQSKPGLSLDATLVLPNSSDISGREKGSSSNDVLLTAEQFYSIAKILEGNGFPPFIRVNPQLVDFCSRLSSNAVVPDTGLELRDESGQFASVEKGSDSDLSSQAVEPGLYSRLSSNGGERGTGIELRNEISQRTPVERSLDSNILFQSAEQSLSSCATGSNIIGTQRAVPMLGLAEMFDLDPLLSSSGERSRRPSIQYHRNLSYSYSFSMNTSCTVTQDTDTPENRAQAATQPLTPAVGNFERVDVGKDPLFSSGALPTEGLGPFDDGELSPLGVLPLGL